MGGPSDASPERVDSSLEALSAAVVLDRPLCARTTLHWVRFAWVDAAGLLTRWIDKQAPSIERRRLPWWLCGRTAFERARRERQEAGQQIVPWGVVPWSLPAGGKADPGVRVPDPGAARAAHRAF